MTPVEWEIDERTKVRLVRDYEGKDGDEVRVIQGDEWVTLKPTGASAHSLIKALIAANEAAGWEVPDLRAVRYDLMDEGGGHE